MAKLLKDTSLLLFTAFALLLSCKPVKLVNTKSDNIKIAVNDTADGENSVKQLIAAYKQELEAEMNTVLAQSQMAMTKAQPEGLLGNFVADLVFEKAQEKHKPSDNKIPDFCLINNGGLRTALPKGDITKGKVFELMPFENEIVVVTLSGEKTKQLFEYIAAYGGQPVSNIQIGIKEGKPKNVMIGKEEFDDDHIYKVVTSDYLANGGDKMDFFLEPLKIEKTGYKIRDAIIDFIEEKGNAGKSISAKLDGRIYVIEP